MGNSNLAKPKNTDLGKSELSSSVLEFAFEYRYFLSARVLSIFYKIVVFRGVEERLFFILC